MTVLTTKSKILSLLEKNRSLSLSGAEIARLLDLSRSAVWKGVEELRADGYLISAITNRGYTLLEENDILSREGLLVYLDNPFIDYGDIHIYESVGSTNQEAKKLAVAGAGQGSLVLAEEQTQGRGRMGRSFYSPKGSGLYMSVVLKPSDMAFQAILATTAAAVAVCRTLSQMFNIEGKIKWVNDIYVDNLKVCGVLAEAVSDFQTGAIESLVIGVGINISTRFSELPEGQAIRETAGSLLNKPHATISRNQIAAKILDELFNLINIESTEKMIGEYRDNSFLLGKPITVYRGNETYWATALDIDALGGLVIKKADGSIDTLRSGEVSVRQIDQDPPHIVKE